MGNLERIPTIELPQSVEAEVPPEVLEMDNNLIGEAKVIFQNNHEYVKATMFGVGKQKADKALKSLAECRKDTMEAVKKFRETKEKCFPSGRLQKFQAADNYDVAQAA